MSRIDWLRDRWLIRRIVSAFNAMGGSMPNAQKRDLLCSLLVKGANDLPHADDTEPQKSPIIITINGGVVNILCRQSPTTPPNET